METVAFNELVGTETVESDAVFIGIDDVEFAKLVDTEEVVLTVLGGMGIEVLDTVFVAKV